MDTSIYTPTNIRCNYNLEFEPRDVEEDRLSRLSKAICNCSQILCWYPIDKSYSSANLLAIVMAFSPSVTIVSSVYCTSKNEGARDSPDC